VAKTLFLSPNASRRVARADVDGAGEHLRGTGEVQQVDPDRDHEDDAAHDLVRVP
jgi:hypothetical protein